MRSVTIYGIKKCDKTGKLPPDRDLWRMQDCATS
jgi:hypothetical protein